MAKVYDFPFLTYQEQIERLRRKYDLVINDNKEATRILSSISYYNIVNGYKSCFMEDEKYDGVLSIEDLYAFHQFDHDIQNILFQCSVLVENLFKTNLSYVIAESFGVHQDDYLNIKNYIKPRQSHRKDKLKQTLSDIKSVYNKSDATKIDYPTRHYFLKKNHIPPWILFKNVNFSTCIDLYSFLEKDQKDKVCNLIIPSSSIKLKAKKKFLSDALTIVRKYRNRIAHDLSFINFKDIPQLTDDVIPLIDDMLYSLSDFKNNIGVQDHYSFFIALYILLRDSKPRIKFLRNLALSITHDVILQSDSRFVKGSHISTQKRFLEMCNFPLDFRNRLDMVLQKLLSLDYPFDYERNEYIKKYNALMILEQRKYRRNGFKQNNYCCPFFTF